MRKNADAVQPEVERAIIGMLGHYPGNSWLVDEHWPLNEPLVRLMVKDVMMRFPPGRPARILDVGCFNGYISVLFRQLGYEVFATDAYKTEESTAVFQRAGVEFVSANMNELTPFSSLADRTFDVVIISQVIEHILNHPSGLIRSLAELMRPGGLMILTTPNPATVMGAIRLLRGNSLLWGTHDFIDEPKISDGIFITKGDIHYREYTRDELTHMITGAGLRVEQKLYLGLGNSRTQSPLKRAVKWNPVTRALMSLRPFASNHYFLANKPLRPEP